MTTTAINRGAQHTPSVAVRTFYAIDERDHIGAEWREIDTRDERDEAVIVLAAIVRKVGCARCRIRVVYVSHPRFFRAPKLPPHVPQLHPLTHKF